MRSPLKGLSADVMGLRQEETGHHVKAEGQANEGFVHDALGVLIKEAMRLPEEYLGTEEGLGRILWG